MSLINLLLAMAALLWGWAGASAAEVRLGPGEALTRAHLHELLHRQDELRQEGRRVDWAITSPRLPMRNPSAEPVTVRLADLRVEEEFERFTGALEVLVGDKVTGELPVGGTLRLMVEVPVPLQTVAEGQKLTAGDLGRAWIAEQTLKAEIVSSVIEVVGQEADRRLLPGRPIRVADVRAPRLVRKGDVVAIVYRGAGLEITTQGRAMEDGSAGQAVRVTNITSERLVRAVVVDHKRVLVGPEATP